MTPEVQEFILSLHEQNALRIAVIEHEMVILKDFIFSEIGQIQSRDPNEISFKFEHDVQQTLRQRIEHFSANYKHLDESTIKLILGFND